VGERGGGIGGREGWATDFDGEGAGVSVLGEVALEEKPIEQTVSARPDSQRAHLAHGKRHELGDGCGWRGAEDWRHNDQTHHHR